MNKKLLKYIVIAVGIVLGVYVSYLQININDNIARIIFFDIGQGDAILIITPEKEKILIDGGPGNVLITKIGKYLPFYNPYIDLIILTHAHDDHVSGLNEVLRRYKVGKILYPGNIQYYAPSYLNWLNIIHENELNLTTTKTGDVYNFSSSSLEILYPFEVYNGEMVEDVNDTSVVARYCYIEICVLLTGDAPIAVEEEIIASRQNIGAKVLKMAHHGSQYSNSEEWLTAVNPEAAIIQSGEGNSFNHPHLRILKRLKRLGINILRNDILGEIVVKTDGLNYWIN